MIFTGEQFVPGVLKPRLAEEHESRYAFALQRASGKKVLDIACGTGYGSAALGQVAESVVGVDVSAESIDFAKSNFQKTNLEFVRASACDPLFAPASFDLITSFETIEHLDEQQRKTYLQNLRSWLKPNGTLLLSTPNKRITSPWNDKPLNRYHVKEFTSQELALELSPFFIIEKFLGQRLVPKIYTYYLTRKSIRLFEKILGFKNNIYDLGNGPEIRPFGKGQEPRVFVLICRPK
jgi:2-polyprenyl-3-methyl-5-hydroxy-6-metoxy-1,4-benzoquinol methylase